MCSHNKELTRNIEVLLETRFSTRSMQRGYEEDNWGNRVGSVWESVKREPEAEESPLLKSVIRKHVVKTVKAGNCLADAVVICELWRLAVAL
jgi:hypothetical protein